MDLRYGENPHQHGAFYRDLWPVPGTLATFTQLQGKELSFNNLADADAAWECVRQFERAGLRDRQARQSLRRGRRRGLRRCLRSCAYATDPTSAFGGIIAFNTHARCGHRQGDPRPPVRRGADRARTTTTARCDYAKKKANVRVLRIPHGDGRNNFDVKRVGSGLLMQTSDIREVTPRRTEGGDASARRPRPSSTTCCSPGASPSTSSPTRSSTRKDHRTHRHRRRADEPRGQSAKIAALKAEEAGLVVPGSVMASDAFFPFRDGIDAAAAAGIRAVIQPGGSMRDNEVIAAADEHGMAMVFTGIRHFRH